MGYHQQERVPREKDGKEGGGTLGGQVGVVQQGDESRPGERVAELKKGISEDSTSRHVTGLQTLLQNVDEESTRLLDQMSNLSPGDVSTVVAGGDDVVGERIEADGGVRRPHRRSAPIWATVEKRVL